MMTTMKISDGTRRWADAGWAGRAQPQPRMGGPLPTAARRLIGALLMLLAVAAPAQESPDGMHGQDVTLVRHADEVTVDNGIVQATIHTPTATVTALVYNGHATIDGDGGHTAIYFSRDGGTSYESLAHCVYSIAKQTPDLVDISCSHVYTPSARDKAPWDVYAHFVLRRGAAGMIGGFLGRKSDGFPGSKTIWRVPDC